MTDSDSIPDDLPPRQRIPAIVAVLLCIVTASVNVTLVNLALPVMAKDFNVDAEHVIYVVSSYQLTLVLSLLVLSNLGDLLGFKRVFLTGAVVFVVASFGCAVSQSLPMLISFRIIQGLGATAIQGTFFSLLTLIYPKQQLGRGMGLCSMTFALATLSGPPLAALILAVGSWHWLFIFNIPFGIVSLILGWHYFPANAVTVTKCPINVSDATLHIFTFGLFFFATSGWSHQPQQCVGNTVLTVLCLVSAFIYILRQRGQKAPFFPIDLLRQGSFGFPIILTILSFTALLTTVVAVPFIFHSRFGYSASQTGLLMTALAGATVVSSMVAGYSIERTKPIYISGIGFMIFALSAFSFALLPENVTVFDLIWRLGLFGIGGGLIQPANNFMAVSSAPAERKGAANGILSTSIMFGQTLGMVLLTVIFLLTGSEAMFSPFYISGIIATMGAVVVCTRLRY